MTEKGYIYFRDNDWFKSNNVYKVGITTSIKDRNNSYITGEIIRGSFIKIIELDVNHSKLKLIDNLIKIEFKYLNVYNNGGTEFYKRNEIYNEIEQFLIRLSIKYNIISENELSRINRKQKVLDNYKTLVLKLKTKTIIPNEHQEKVLLNIKSFYDNNDIGKICWCCGIGKTIMSILIVRELQFNKILIGVSSNYLQEQFLKEILLVFDDPNILLIGSINNKSTTDIKKIKLFLSKKEADKPLFIITTYHSCYLLNDSDIKFDFKIGDECHHLVGVNKEDNNNFKLFHKIQSTKTLFMTATEKIIDNKIENGYSMNDEKKFGSLIDSKSTKWAIENNKITKYLLIIIKNNLSELDEIKNKLTDDIKNKHLFICCYMTLKSLSSHFKITHTLIYTNNIIDANLCYEYIKIILSYNIIDINNDDIYYTSLHSKINNDVIKNSLQQFNSSKFAIISCVQIFGEGVDLPILNGICVACNMLSETRITQYLLRPNRLDKNNPKKIAYYIFPYIDESDYQNIINIIRQLKNTDDNIEQLMTIANITNCNDTGNYTKSSIINNINIKDNTTELIKIKLRMKSDNVLSSSFTHEQDEYNYVKNLNINLNIKSKKDYYLSRTIHDNYIENPEKYFINNGVWENWSDFLGYDTSLFLQTKTQLIEFCKNNNINDIDSYNEATEIYKELPKDPEDFYTDFNNIESELDLIENKTRRENDIDF